MEIIHSDKLITVLRRGLNLIDERLTDHGVKVMLVLKDMLKADGCRDARIQKNMAILALLHDIGAYRKEEIDDLVQFEVGNIWQHSIYGYLFIREFTPLKEWAEVILYHHEDCHITADLPETVRYYAQMLHTADRVVVWHDEVRQPEAELEKHFCRKRDIVFSSESIDAWQKCQKTGTYSKLDDLSCLENALNCCLFDDTEANAYLAMLIHAIDFRSRDTVTHTIGVMEIGQHLARRMDFSEEICEQIHYGAMLHDLGKIGTPVSILESPGRLSPQEMEIMRHHVVLSGQILDGCIDETIARIALRHHEKLNGSGYPQSLAKEDLTLPERLLAIADIASALCMSRSYKEPFSKERCLSILWEMCQKGELDSAITAALEKNFDEIMAQADAACIPLRDNYSQIRAEYETLLHRFQLLPR